MVITNDDSVSLQKVLAALVNNGLRSAEATTASGKCVTAYYVTDKQVRIDIIEKHK